MLHEGSSGSSSRQTQKACQKHLEEKKNEAYLCAQHSAVLGMLTLVPAALAGRCVRCCEAAAEMLYWPSEAEVTPSCAGRTMLPPPHGLCWVLLARLAWEKASGESRVAMMTGQCLVRGHQGEQARGAEKQTVLWSLTRMLSCVSSEVLKGRPHLFCTGIKGAVAADCKAEFWCSSSLWCPWVLADCCFLSHMSVGSDRYDLWIFLTGPFREDKMPRKKVQFNYTILWFS